MATAIEVHDLRAWFGKAEVLHGINISIEANHATAQSLDPRAAGNPHSFAA
jgi:ABC-type phosphate transport system ATPase subunit